MKDAERIVVRIEIATLYNAEGQFDYRKMDRLAMNLTNLNNSGKEILLVSSGAIALGMRMLEVKQHECSTSDTQAIAAVGQAELMRFYQKYFEQYNQMVAQVLLSGDVTESETRVVNAQNTFNELLDMNIIPIINENDSVSTADIELDDNYPLALNVARIAKAELIMVKTNKEDNYILVPRGQKQVLEVTSEKELFEKLEGLKAAKKAVEGEDFPENIADFVYAKA